jgi:YD repeat-containing protein
MALAVIAGALAPPAALAGSVTYTYDEQGRVTSAAYTDGTYVCYAYDTAGNRTWYASQTTSCSSTPTAGAVSATVNEDSSNDPIALNITGGVATSVAVSTGAAHGTATATGTAITYTPTSGYTGSDSFQYTASNSGGTSSPATVSITVALIAPIANNVSATVYENTSSDPITLSITGGAATSVAVSTAPSHGSASASGTSITYTPTSGYTGSDIFQYTATNSGGTSSPATASITVAAPVTHTYTSGSGTETVPSGVSTVTITMWSGGAAGGRDNSDGGGGGGGGCQAVQTISVTPGNTFSYSVAAGAGGRSTNGTGQSGAASSVSGSVSGGTVSLSTSAVATGGQITNGRGTGATCSGGTDTSGSNGGRASGGAGGGTGGGAGGVALGSSGSVPGGGGAGGLSGSSGAGAGGEIIFVYP